MLCVNFFDKDLNVFDARESYVLTVRDAPGDDATELAVMVHRLADALEAATQAGAATEARIDRWMQLVGKAVEKRMTAEAERDAALAAIERVRELVEEWRYGMPEYTSSHYQEGQKVQQQKLVGQLLAALDGAPEPEVKP